MQKPRILIVDAGSLIGDYLAGEFSRDNQGLEIRLAARDAAAVADWKRQGYDAVVFDLCRPEGFDEALKDVDRLFISRNYTSEMIFQSRMLIDAALNAGVEHIVYAGVYSSPRDLIPHFPSHDIVETYIEVSSMDWTHMHPNVIADLVLLKDAPASETGEFSMSWDDKARGWVFAPDIGAVAAVILREGPQKHAFANYSMSTEILTGRQAAAILAEAAGKEIKCNLPAPEDHFRYAEQISDPSAKNDRQSGSPVINPALIHNKQAQSGVTDDVQTLLGRPALTMAQWAGRYFSSR